MVVLFSVIILISVVGLSFFITSDYQELIVDTLGMKAKFATEKSISTINSEDFKKVKAEIMRNPGSDAHKAEVLKMPEFIKTHERLSEIREMFGLKFVFSVVELPDKSFMYIVDSENIESKDFSSPGDIEKEDSGATAVYQTKKTTTGDLIVNDKWGASIASYAPIMDKDGTMIGALGAEYDASEIYAKMQATKHKIIIGTVIAVLAASLLSFIFASRIVKPLQLLVAHVQNVAAGDLTARLTLNDKSEIGDLFGSFNKMTENLRTLVKQVATFADGLVKSTHQTSVASEAAAEAANQIAVTITSVATGSEQQLHAVQATLETVEQVAATVEQVSLNVDTAMDISKKAVFHANDGSKAVDTAINQMNKIEKAVANSVQVVGKLDAHSKEIGQIVTLISGVAKQTNLLALNAAIEAARAGEQGRGFALVAEEVRTLAEQSQSATKQIDYLVSEMKNETHNAVYSMNVGTKEVQTGLDVVNNAGVKFNEIVTLIEQVAAEVSNVSAFVEHVTTSSQQTLEAVREIERIGKAAADQTETVSAATEEQSASVEEIAALNQHLSKLADEVKKAIHQFRA
jgi:methyl-accepting chemotaxis protein